MKSAAQKTGSATSHVAIVDGTVTACRISSARFGLYRPLAKLGEGGMGVVYVAFEDETQSFVAIKVLPRRRWNEARAVARFQREIGVTARFCHPNVVQAIKSR